MLATFGAGCFWGVEEIFRQVKGVTSTAVGYMGGRTKNPTYEEVCSDKSGHAEVVQVEYDPKQVTYENLLKVFFENHNPTQGNRQGPDVGSQYRSAIFVHDEKQKNAAAKKILELTNSKKFGKPITTTIEKAKEFWRAEEYHQLYLAKRSRSSCHI